MANGKNVTKPVVIPIKFKGDSSQVIKDIDALKGRLQSISSEKKLDLLKIDKSSVTGAIKQVETLQKLIEKSKDFSGEINPFKWATNLKSSNMSMSDLNANLKRLGQGTLEVEKLENALGKLPQPIRKVETALDKMGRTLVNTLRYNIANNFVDSIMGSGTQVIDYLEDVDKNLNNIRIVTGKANTQMEGFNVTALKSAKTLGKVTGDYLKGSELYYQQGLATNDVIERTEATMKASNIAAQDVGTTADQVTAVLNGFNISASETVSTLDKLAAVGAGTATDFEEIAKASQKVASSANEAGMSLDDTLGILSTISSVTREAPEAIGTSLNAIIGRFSNLKIGDEVSSGIEKAFKSANTGLTSFNEETGQLKDITQILEELAAKWNDLSINQQRAATTAIAGTRQANRLMALMGNWDMFESYRKMSEESTGALEEQNTIYLEGLEALKNQQQATMEEMWSNFLDVDTIKEFYSWLTKITEKFADITKAVGGIGPILTNVMALIQKPIMGMIAPSIANASLNKATSRSFGGSETGSEKELQALAQRELSENFNIETKILSMQERKNYLTDDANKKYAESIKLFSRLLELNKRLEQSKISGEIETTVTKRNSAGADVLTKGKVDFGGPLGVDKVLSALQDDFMNSVKSEKYASEEINNLLNEKIAKNKEEIALKEKALKLDKSATAESKQQIKNEIEALKTQNKKYNADKLSEKTQEKINARSSGYVSMPSKEFMRMNVKTSFGKTQDKLLDNDDPFAAANLNQQRDLINKMLESESTYNTVNSITARSATGKEYGAADLFLNKQKGISSVKLEADEYQRVFDEMVQALRLTLKDEKTSVEAMSKEKFDIEKSPERISAERNLKDTENAAKRARTFDIGFKSIITGGQALQTFNTIADESVSTQDKLTATTNALGTAMSMIPGTAGLIGIAISFLGPALIEMFDIGISESERLTKSLAKVTDSFNSVTKAVKQQKQDLAPVNELYKKLAEEYENQAFTYEQLTEEQQSQYSQVSEYVTQYAPELVKYYDAEGRAVLDLTKGYEYLTSSFKDYQAQTYSTLTGSTASNFDDLLRINKVAKEEQDELLIRQQEIQQKMLAGGNVKSLETQLAKVAEEIAANNITLASFGKNYNNLVVEPVLMADRGFLDLDTSIQNTFRSLMSLDEVLASTSSNYSGYIKDLQGLMLVFNNSSEGTINKFKEMDSAIREGILKTLLYANDSFTELSQKMESITQESFLSGELLLNFDREKAIAALEREQQSTIELRDSYSKLLEAKQESNQEIVREATQQQEQITNTGPYASSPANAGTRPAVVFETFDTAPLENDLDAVIEKLEKLNEVTVDNEEELREYYQEQQDVIKNIFLDSTYEFSQASAANFNAVKAKFDELNKELENNTISEASQDLMNSYKAILNADNADYFTAFKEQNAAQTATLDIELGIRADSYKTFSEYKLAIDDAYNKKRQLLETAITQGMEAANKLRAQFAFEETVKKLAADGAYEEASLLLQADATERDKLATLYAEKDKLSAQQRSLQSQLDSLKSANAAKAKGYAEDVHAFELAEEDKARIVATTTGVAQNFFASGLDVDKYVTQASEIALQKQIDAIGNSIVGIDGEIAQAQKSIQDRLGESFDVNYYNNLVGSMDSVLADFNYEVDGFTKIDERLEETKQSIDDGLGGGDSGKTSAFKLELDPLRKYIIEIERLNNELTILADQKEKAYGVDYINILKKESAVNRDIAKTTEEKIKKIEQLAATRKAVLKDSGVEFDEFGSISNYNELLTERSAGLNSGDADEETRKAVEDLKAAMDDYESYAIDKMRESQAELMRIRKELAEAAQEQIEYPIKLIIEAQENDKKLIDFLAEIEKTNGGRITFSIGADATSKNLVGALGSLQDLMSSGGGMNDFTDNILNNPDLKDNTALQLEMINNQQNNLQNMASSMMQLSEQMAKAFGESLGEAISLIDEEISKFTDIANQYEYLMSLAKQLNKADSTVVDDSYNKLSEIFKNNIDTYKSLAKTIKESRDSFAVGSEDWITANGKYLEVQGKVMEQEKQLAQLLGQKYDDSVSAGRSKLEEMLFGGMTAEEAQSELDKMNKIRAKYLDTETRIAQISKLESSIQKDITKANSNTKVQEQLKRFMDTEVKYLNEKKDLTQDDLDITQKQYNILKARIDLEEAYNNKQYEMILQRNENGTMGYMFVQNTEGIEEAQQKYKDSIDDLYQYSVARNKELQQESIDIRKDALSEYDKILKKLKDGTISEEEAVAQLGDAFKEMTDDLQKNSEEQAKMQQQITSSKIMQLLGAGSEQFSGITTVSETLKNVFDILGNSGEITNFTDTLSSLGLDTANFTGSIGDQIEQAYNALGGNEDALKLLMDAFTESGDSTAATILGLLRENGDINELTKEIFENNLASSGDKFEELLDKISSGNILPGDLFTDNIIGGIDQVGTIWDKVAGMINLDLEKLIKEFNITDPSSTLGMVTENIINAFGEYSDALSDAYDRVLEDEYELADMTDVLNGQMEDTLDLLEEEIENVAALTQEYNKMRKEIADALKEVAAYIEELIDLKNELMNMRPSGGGGGGGSSGGGTNGGWDADQVPDDSKYKGKEDTWVADGDRWDYVDSSGNVHVGADDSGSYWDPKSGSWKGSSKFHTGGTVGVKEGNAIVLENERVLTETQAAISDKIYQSLKGLEQVDPKVTDSLTSLNAQVDGAESLKQTVYVTAEFPNAVDRDEISEAFKTLSQNAQQYINKG